MQLLELAGRVEAATGPDRELDAEIARAVDLLAGTRASYELNLNLIPAYTASLDAAMTLVPADEADQIGVFWQLGHDGEGIDPSLFKARILVVTLFTTKTYTAYAATPALALVAASLRARAGGQA